MCPTHFNFETDTTPIYYSLQNPSTHIFSPKSREVTNTIYELRELENIMRVFTEELSKSNSPCNDTIVGEIANQVEFNFYHSKQDKSNVVKMTDEIARRDSRFIDTEHKIKKPNAVFSTDAPFLRGCISITRKH